MNVKTGTGLFTNFIKVCVPIIALAVACSSKAAAHFNPGDRVEAAVTISCPDPGICSCVIPQGTQGTVLCYDAEDAEYPGGYPYFVHWDNGCNTYWDVDSGNFVDYCAESDDWGVWMTSDEITSASSHEHCDRDHLYLCNTVEICSSAGLHWCAGQCQQDPCPVVPPTPNIQANGSDGPITIPTEGDMSLSVALDCGSMSGLNADWWLGAQTPSGWYYFDVAQGTWMPGTSFLIWQGPLFSFSNVELPGSISLPEGSSTFYFVIDTNINGLLDANLYYDSVVVQMMQESLPSQPETFTNSLGMTFNLIPAGTFMMGSPKDELERFSDETQHQVTLTRSFYMQTTEVTQAQWETVMGSNPSYFSKCGGNCPVEYVSWNDVQDFIAVLNSRGEGTYRLPTEAEWEYAARAGSTTAFANGDITVTDCSLDPNLDAMGWYCGNSAVTYDGCADDSYWGGQSCAGTNPAAQKLPNAWGLYDMHGNLWEWVRDWYNDYPTTAMTDPTGPETGSYPYRVLRGGSWDHYALGCRSACRFMGIPDDRYGYAGFRLLRQL